LYQQHNYANKHEIDTYGAHNQDQYGNNNGYGGNNQYQNYGQTNNYGQSSNNSFGTPQTFGTGLQFNSNIQNRPPVAQGGCCCNIMWYIWWQIYYISYH